MDVAIALICLNCVAAFSEECNLSSPDFRIASTSDKSPTCELDILPYETDVLSFAARMPGIYDVAVASSAEFCRVAVSSRRRTYDLIEYQGSMAVKTALLLPWKSTPGASPKKSVAPANYITMHAPDLFGTTLVAHFG